MPTINNFKESKYILVTGAAGYIGATFTYEALKKGYYVLGLDNFSNSNKKIYFDDDIIEIKNDFYPLILKNYSEFDEIINFLNSSELKNFSITGSGSAIFSIIDSNVNVDELKSYIESSNKFQVSINTSIEGWRFQID